MSLKPEPIQPVPKETARVAKAAFPKGNLYLTLRDKLGTIFRDEDFADLFPKDGQPALPPWRLALVTILQFRENLPDRQAAETLRARIDWKYLLGLELTDPGFDFSVLSEFRDRLIEGGKEAMLLNKLLENCRTLGLVKARGRQRTDATNILAAIRFLNRLELLAETMRAALNELATVAPDWLRSMAPAEWYERYGRRIEDERLPQGKDKRNTYAELIGEDGFHLLRLLEAPGVPKELYELPKVQVLIKVWKRHYKREKGKVRIRPGGELNKDVEGIVSPYDPEARFRRRFSKQWIGYMVNLSESCDDESVHLITHVETTDAITSEANMTEVIHHALQEKTLLPDQHLVDTAYVDAELLVNSQEQFGVSLVGPGRPDGSWQAKTESAYDRYQFDIDWENRRVFCPQGKQSTAWYECIDQFGLYYHVKFADDDCLSCEARSLCTRHKSNPRAVRLQPKAQFEALKAARQLQSTEEGRKLYNKRAGVEGTISQGVRSFELRRTRYHGLDKTHLKNVATGAAINFERLGAWFDELPRSKTPKSRFARIMTMAA